MEGKGKQRMVVKEEIADEIIDRELSDDDDDEYSQMENSEDCYRSNKKKKVVASSSTGGGKKGSCGGGGMRCCQAEKCMVDLNDAKPYHRRHKVCEYHAKAQIVLVAGIRQRFCQQCSRFHELSEFDDAKRSCRKRLAGHNERRRKNATESHTEGSGHKGAGTQLKDMVFGQVGDRGRIKITIQENATYRHFQIR